VTNKEGNSNGVSNVYTSASADTSGLVYLPIKNVVGVKPAQNWIEGGYRGAYVTKDHINQPLRQSTNGVILLDCHEGKASGLGSLSIQCCSFLKL